MKNQEFKFQQDLNSIFSFININYKKSMKIKVYIEREKVDKNIFRNARGERYPFFNLRTSGCHLHDYSYT